MKKLCKTVSRWGVFVIGLIAILLTGMAAVHHIRLWLEAPAIHPLGTRVLIDGYEMNVYTEGNKKNPQDPVLDLLSGSGVAAPIYDYKILYSKLSGDYKTVVVEKFGYGYSQVSGKPRDVVTMVEENRQALQAAGIGGPYVLMPHSMSALETIYWTSAYPEEVAAVIGLDMAVPDSYMKDNLSQIALLRASVFFGFHRLDFLNPLNRRGLSAEEIKQNQLLTARNSLNGDVWEECRSVMANAEAVRELNLKGKPLLMFSTNLAGSPEGEAWLAAQIEFARQNQGRQIRYDCDHNLHYTQSEEMASLILDFLADLPSIPN